MPFHSGLSELIFLSKKKCEEIILVSAKGQCFGI